MSVVFYKFRSAKDFDQAVFDGTGISVFDLKREIIINKKLGKGTDFDIAIYNAQSNEEYSDDSAIIPRNSSVLVNRNPASRPGKGTAQRYLNNTMAFGGGGGRGRPVAAPLPGGPSLPKNMTLINNVTNNKPATTTTPTAASSNSQAMTEEERIAAMFSNQESQWQQEQEKMAMQRPVARQWSGPGFRGRGGFTPGGPPRDANASQKPGTESSGGSGTAPSATSAVPPAGGQAEGGDWYGSRAPKPGYICYRCGQKGHFINACPTIGDKEYDRPKLKRTTGIPRMFLKVVEDKSSSSGGSGVMVTQNGELVVAAPNSHAWSKVQPTATSFAGVGDIYEMAPVLPEFECSSCHKNMKDPVSMPCCKAKYCDECIRDLLLENEDHSKRFRCPSCGTNCTPDQLISEPELRDAIEAHLRDFVSKSSHRDVPHSKSVSPVPPHSTLREDSASNGRPSPRNSPNPPESSSTSSQAKARPYRIIDSAASGDRQHVNPGPGYVQRNQNSIPVVSLSEAQNDRYMRPQQMGMGMGGGMRGRGGYQMGGMRGGYNYGRNFMAPQNMAPMGTFSVYGDDGEEEQTITYDGNFDGFQTGAAGIPLPGNGMNPVMNSNPYGGYGFNNGMMPGGVNIRRDDMKRKREVDAVEVGARDQRSKAS
ncbi:hypothetical protein HDU97_000556 [Phlyctochytrium planicorne]|nr:hypothetical protein HDU97_000556 [Phlyctochytrium planicorne]